MKIFPKVKFKFDLVKFGEHTTKPSQTTPNLAPSLFELLDRFRKGQDISYYGSMDTFEGQDEKDEFVLSRNLDILDAAQYNMEMANNLDSNTLKSEGV